MKIFINSSHWGICGNPRILSAGFSFVLLLTGQFLNCQAIHIYHAVPLQSEHATNKYKGTTQISCGISISHMQYDAGLTVIEVGYASVSPVSIKHKQRQ